ncbi:MAG: serine/threonine protein kinase [Oscillatoria sp. SIO1A7]|nr:serine/threonine protein kinase [Oscillatoria sp. SIO1A7]
MEIYCTRPGCPKPLNHFRDLDDNATLKTVTQKYCTSCGMPLILDGRYLPERLLGQGGFGAAFLARDRRSPTLRQCAVKQFQPSGDLNPEQLAIAQKLFDTEALVLDSLGSQHPQIPVLLAFFPLEAPGWPSSVPAQFFYIVQEFIDGRDLQEELEQKGKFSEPEVLEILLEILKILKFVHENDAIHRDIKPSNIMRDRSSGRLYLLDFGAVKQIAQGAGSSASGSSTGIYSMGFAPPEQMAGRTVFPSTDLYALAVTCITLLTGKETQELFDSYSNEWNWQNHVAVSGNLADVLDRMLLPTPSDRFGSAEQVLAALAPQAPKPPLSPPATSPPTTSPPPPNTSVPVSPPPVSPSTSIQSPPAPRQPTIPPPPSPGPIAASSSASKPVPQPAPRPSFSTLEILGGAAFTGFEGGLLAIALSSAIGSPLLSAIIWAALLAALIWAQSIRAIAKQDLAIIAGVSLAIVIIVAPLRVGLTAPAAMLFSVLAGLGAIALTALFRLVYTFLSRIF